MFYISKYQELTQTLLTPPFWRPKVFKSRNTSLKDFKRLNLAHIFSLQLMPWLQLLLSFFTDFLIILSFQFLTFKISDKRSNVIFPSHFTCSIGSSIPMLFTFNLNSRRRTWWKTLSLVLQRMFGNMLSRNSPIYATWVPGTEGVTDTWVVY